MEIRFDHGPDGQGAAFANPQRLIVANEPAELRPALAALDRARSDGFWLAGYVTYEAGYAFEPKLAGLMPTHRRLPLLRFGVYDAPRHPRPISGTGGLGDMQPRWDKTRYGEAFDQVKQAIGNGEIYQANLTMPLDAQWSGDPEGLYAALKARQPVNHGGLVTQPGLPSILSRSPELFFRTDRQGQIETRPMKGTSPREQDPVQDQANRVFLQNDEKNRAENLMIVDLLRNDISRIAETGSVHVPELFAVESYATVHQMVSTVAARLQPDVGLSEIFAALFPCGSITGAPKIKAMEILRRLEPWPREIYCGTLGWAAPDGLSEFNVAIRTLLLEANRAVLNVGGGVVWDSTAKAEYQEALWKARFAKMFQLEPC